MDAFLDGTISRDDRNARLAKIDQDIQLAQDLLASTNPAASLSLDSLAEAFAPLIEWEYWTREQKRLVLAALVPDIWVADYQVAALGLDAAIFSNDERYPQPCGFFNDKSRECRCTQPMIQRYMQKISGR